LVGRTGQKIQLSRYELTKIDVLKKGAHYADVAELGEMMSVAKVFSDIQVTDPQLLHLRLVETHDGATTNLQITVNQDTVRIETHHLFPANGAMEVAFGTANKRVNDVFFGLVKDLKTLGGEDAAGDFDTKSLDVGAGACSRGGVCGSACYVCFCGDFPARSVAS